jgi:hypothetical protein
MQPYEKFMARVSALRERAQEAITRLEKAAPKGRKRIPGDGDGDGIPHEGRKPKGGAAMPMKPAKPPMSMGDATAAYPKAAKRIAGMKEGQKLWVTTGTGPKDFAQLQREGDKVNVLQSNVRPSFMPKQADEKQVPAGFERASPWKPNTPSIEDFMAADLARRHAAQTKPAAPEAAPAAKPAAPAENKGLSTSSKLIDQARTLGYKDAHVVHDGNTYTAVLGRDWDTKPGWKKLEGFIAEKGLSKVPLAASVHGSSVKRVY